MGGSSSRVGKGQGLVAVAAALLLLAGFAGCLNPRPEELPSAGLEPVPNPAAPEPAAADPDLERTSAPADEGVTAMSEPTGAPPSALAPPQAPSPDAPEPPDAGADAPDAAAADAGTPAVQ